MTRKEFSMVYDLFTQTYYNKVKNLTPLFIEILVDPPAKLFIDNAFGGFIVLSDKDKVAEYLEMKNPERLQYVHDWIECTDYSNICSLLYLLDEYLLVSGSVIFHDSCESLFSAKTDYIDLVPQKVLQNDYTSLSIGLVSLDTSLSPENDKTVLSVLTKNDTGEIVLVTDFLVDDEETCDRAIEEINLWQSSLGVMKDTITAYIANTKNKVK